MSDFLLTHEPALRLAFFLTILLAMVIWEFAAPRRRLEIPRLFRWSNNLGIVVRPPSSLVRQNWVICEGRISGSS